MNLAPGELLGFALLGVGIVRVIWRSTRVGSIRRAAVTQPASFQSRVAVKYRYGAIPGWAQRVKGPMELRIRGQVVEVSMARPFPGIVLGVNCYLHGPETVMSTDSDRAPSKQKGWIVLTGIQSGKRLEVAILPHGPQEEVLHALQTAGVRMG